MVSWAVAKSMAAIFSFSAFTTLFIVSWTSFGGSISGNAQLLRRLETVEKALGNNAQIVIPSNAELINVGGELAGGILPVPRKEEKK